MKENPIEELEEVLAQMQETKENIDCLAERLGRRYFFNRNLKEKLMSELDDLTNEFAQLATVVPEVVGYIQTLQAEVAAAAAAGSASVPLTALDPFVTQGSALLASLGSALPAPAAPGTTPTA